MNYSTSNDNYQLLMYQLIYLALFYSRPSFKNDIFAMALEIDWIKSVRKNKNYFEKDLNGEKLPYLEAVAITFLPDKQSEFLCILQQQSKP